MDRSDPVAHFELLKSSVKARCIRSEFLTKTQKIWWLSKAIASSILRELGTGPTKFCVSLLLYARLAPLLYLALCGFLVCESRLLQAMRQRRSLQGD